MCWLRHVKPRKNKQSKKKRISGHICMHRGVLDERMFFGKFLWALAEKRYAYRRLLTKQMSMSNINWKTVWSPSFFLLATLAPLLSCWHCKKNRQKFFFTYVLLILNFPNHAWIFYSEKQSSLSLPLPPPALRRQHWHRNFPQISANSSSFRTHDSGYYVYENGK